MASDNEDRNRVPPHFLMNDMNGFSRTILFQTHHLGLSFQSTEKVNFVNLEVVRRSIAPVLREFPWQV